MASLALFLPILASAKANLPISFRYNKLSVLEYEPEKTTGLDNIYVIYDTSGMEMVFSSRNPSQVKVYKYSNLGGGYAEEISDIHRDMTEISISNFKGNLGYIFEDGSDRYYIWVVDYLPYRFTIRNIEPSAVQDCDATLLDVDGAASPIHYFTINGQQRELSRDIKVNYDTQEFDSSSFEFKTVAKQTLIPSFDHTVRISPASLSYTSFHIKGDRFLEAWNWSSEAESIVISPSAVAVMTSALQEGISSDISEDIPGDSTEADSSEGDGDNNDEPGSNIIKGDDSALGGSAPADISFEAFVSEGVMHYEWQMSRDPEFEEIDYRFNVSNLDYTFMEEGTYYLRFIGSNSDGSCEAVSDTYTVSIGSSELLCPNAFSPDDDGVNDIWKVSYRSLVEFDCWIFDRYGAQLYHFNDPQGGWDGKRGGKVVKPGVYYYVITAVGADGKKYKKSGDINILRRRSVTTPGTESAE